MSKLKVKEKGDELKFAQVVENEYVTTVCLPWWDEEEDYMRFSFDFLSDLEKAKFLLLFFFLLG